MALFEREDSDALPLLWQAELLSLSRSRLNYEPRPARDAEIAIKHRLDEWYTERPCLGTRKPAPDIFLLAAKRLGAAPEECVVYEDGIPGIEAAKRAGIRCVDIRVLWETGTAAV